MMKSTMFRLSLLLLGFFLLNNCDSIAQSKIEELKAEEWKEDLNFLSQKINNQFAFFTPQNKKQFNDKVVQLEKNIDQLSADQIVIEMNKMVAALKDGHTELNLLQSAIAFHRLPLLMYYFGNDLHIVLSSPEYKHLLGKKLVKIGQHSVQSVYEKMIPYLAHENEIEFLLEAPNYMTGAELLASLGIIENINVVNLTLEDESGKTEEFQVNTQTLADFSQNDWQSVRGDKEAPLYSQQGSKYYWFTYLEESKTMFFKCNRFGNQDGQPSLKKTVSKLFQEVDKKQPEKLIIDLRRNRGGNYKLGRIIISEIKKRPGLNQKGRLFVLTDRYTFSAAAVTAGFLKRDTQTLVAGEPNRSRPNGADNYEPYKLPNSKIRFGVTNRTKDHYPELGDAPYLPLDIPVDLTFEDYKNGQDPVLIAIMNYE